MKNGWVVECPKCGTKIDDFSLTDEWFCDCGEHGILDYGDSEDEEEEDDDGC